jgi:hypothetical protein
MAHFCYVIFHFCQNGPYLCVICQKSTKLSLIINVKSFVFFKELLLILFCVKKRRRYNWIIIKIGKITNFSEKKIM